jgi:chloramphenicol-sensitive protein RarD
LKNKGLLFALGAYGLWGLFPIYWKWLRQVDAVQLIGHRIGWSFLLLIVFIALTRQWQAFWRAALHRRILLIYSVAALLIGVNWLVYVWAVNANYVVESSLGYFINPLLSVLMGVIFLRERLRPWQWLPVVLAASGVVYLTVAYGRPPWIALTLAFSFGTYGLVKKLAPLGSLYGLTLETGILFLPAVIYLLYADFSGSGAFLRSSLSVNLLLVGAGLVTTIPLLMFASAAQQIPLSVVGLLQFITPTIQFLLGILVYHEPFDQPHFIGFGIVWAALIVFAAENFWARRVLPVEPIPELGEG